MKVSALRLYLDSLVSALSASDASPDLLKDLEQTASGIQPFSDLDFRQFAAFLNQAEVYRCGGHIAIPSSASVEAEGVQAPLRAFVGLSERLRSALSNEELASEHKRLRDELEGALNRFLGTLAINVSLKVDTKGFEKMRAAARLQGVTEQVREALRDVTDEAALAAPERQQRLATLLDPLPVAELKIVATQLQAPNSARTRPLLVAAIVKQLTGVTPAAKSSSRRTKTAASVDQALVGREAVRLKGMLEQSIEPDALKDEDVAKYIEELQNFNLGTLSEIMREAGQENVSRKKADMIKKIELKLTRSRREREGMQV